MAFGKKTKKIKKGFFANNDVKKTLHKNLEFTAIEQYKLLRTNLDFTLPEGVQCPVIGITSAMRGEGKSTTAINLSYVMAEKEDKVLLIGGDLRLPSLAKRLEIPSKPGLTDLLMGEHFDIENYRSNLLDNWYVLPSGTVPPNPSELLGSRRMAALLKSLREKFDYIIIDLPPVNIVSDALSIANLITGMIIVVREGYTEKNELERCLRLLKLSNVNLLGCIMNEVDSGTKNYSKYRYKKYKYYRSSKEYKD